MNRIVLIGNGFDLAHGLKTSYADFINWYWEQLMNKILFSMVSDINDGLCKVKLKSDVYGFYNHFTSTKPADKSLNGYDFLKYLKEDHGFEIQVSPLLEEIMNTFTSNWVDIESTHYRLLCKSLSMDECNAPMNAIQLNHDLWTLTIKLREYLTLLTSENKVTINQKIQDKILEPIHLQDIAVAAKECTAQFIEERCTKSDVFDLLEYFGYNYSIHKRYLENAQKEYQDKKKIDITEEKAHLLLPDKVLILNFNYTKVADSYVNEKLSPFSIIHIHGDLEQAQNMIFGYGDEIDKHYKELVDLNDNVYLKHIKSHRYLDAEDYRHLLQFVNDAPYQIYVMGHSCGNSDRTLLNTLFEHENCVSIEPFYYIKDNGLDNYNEITQNISRNFTNKQALRDKVVNKKYCEPLIPQTKKETLSSLDYYISLIKNMNIPKIGNYKAPYKPMLMLALINAVNDLHRITREEKISLIPFKLDMEKYFETIWNNHRFYGLHFNYDIAHVLLYMDKEPFYKLSFSDKLLEDDSLQAIRESYEGIVLDDELIKLIIDPTSCTKLIETLEDMLNPNKELSPSNPITA